MQKTVNNGKKSSSQKRGFSLPTTTSKPPMPPVKSPKTSTNKK